jgi:hypothetical protein
MELFRQHNLIYIIFQGKACNCVNHILGLIAEAAADIRLHPEGAALPVLTALCSNTVPILTALCSNTSHICYVGTEGRQRIM